MAITDGMMSSESAQIKLAKDGLMAVVMGELIAIITIIHLEIFVDKVQEQLETAWLHH